MLKQYQWKRIPIRLLLFVFALNIIGIAVIGSAQASVQDKQIFGMGLGIFVMLVVALFDYSFILRFHWLIYAAGIVLLLLVRFFGDHSLGATRWFEIGSFRFQPSEVVKICVILFFAWYFNKFQEKINDWRVIIGSGVLIFLPWFLIMDQPDLSTSIVVALIFLSLLFVAGLSYKIIGGVLAVVIPAAVIFLYLVLQPGQEILEDYQLKRILAWLDPEKYTDNAQQQQNAIMAIGSGQLFGKGLNNQGTFSVKNGNWIPEPQTDFIFAIVGEELGFIGTVTVILLLLLIVLECIIIGRKAKDLSGKLICGGVAAYIGFQAFINLCVVTGLMPNTGLTLPFVSYGLTSLVSLYISIGLVINVALQPKKYRMGDHYP